jgi:Cu(I)/Ag(I) efflux system membrane protein CusA/SilA
MLVEPFASFIVPTLYCAFLEFKMRAGFRDEIWEESSGVSVDDAPQAMPMAA